MKTDFGIEKIERLMKEQDEFLAAHPRLAKTLAPPKHGEAEAFFTIHEAEEWPRGQDGMLQAYPLLDSKGALWVHCEEDGMWYSPSWGLSHGQSYEHPFDGPWRIFTVKRR